MSEEHEEPAQLLWWEWLILIGLALMLCVYILYFGWWLLFGSPGVP